MFGTLTAGKSPINASCSNKNQSLIIGRYHGPTLKGLNTDTNPTLFISQVPSAANVLLTKSKSDFYPSRCGTRLPLPIHLPGTHAAACCAGFLGPVSHWGGAGRGRDKGRPGGKGGGEEEPIGRFTHCFLLLSQKETQSQAGMPGTLVMQRLYVRGRWNVYSNKTPVACTFEPAEDTGPAPPMGHQLQVSSGSRRGGTRTNPLGGPAGGTFPAADACVPPTCAS